MLRIDNLSNNLLIIIDINEEYKVVVLFIKSLLYGITYLNSSIIPKSWKHIKNKKFILRLFALLDAIYNNKIHGLLNVVKLVFWDKF